MARGSRFEGLLKKFPRGKFFDRDVPRRRKGTTGTSDDTTVAERHTLRWHRRHRNPHVLLCVEARLAPPRSDPSESGFGSRRVVQRDEEELVLSTRSLGPSPDAPS